MSAYLDTGSVLIESACNVERIAALLYTLAPFVPNFKYFRSVLVCIGQYCRSDHVCKQAQLLTIAALCAIWEELLLCCMCGHRLCLS